MCENAVNDQKQYARRNCLLFYGIEEVTGEDCDEEVINLSKEQLHIEITPTMIERSHRIGPRKDQQIQKKNETIYSKILFL